MPERPTRGRASPWSPPPIHSLILPRPHPGKEPGLFDLVIVNDNLDKAYHALEEALLEVGSHLCTGEWAGLAAPWTLARSSFHPQRKSRRLREAVTPEEAPAESLQAGPPCPPALWPLLWDLGQYPNKELLGYSIRKPVEFCLDLCTSSLLFAAPPLISQPQEGCREQFLGDQLWPPGVSLGS